MDDIFRTGLKDNEIKKIRKEISRCPRVEKAVLFGSRAKGSSREYSDIDLTLSGSGLIFEDLLILENRLDDLLLPYKIDLSLLSLIGSKQVREHIEKAGIVFYERDSSTETPHA